MSTRASFRVGLVSVMGLLVVAHVGGLVLHRSELGVMVGSGSGLLSGWMAAVLCWLAVRGARSRRWEVVTLAAAVTCQVGGFTYDAVVLALGGAVPFPSLADVSFLLFYPLMLASLVLVVRSELRGLASSVWLDSAVGALGAASVLAVVLSPVLGHALAGSRSLAAAVAIAYPAGDMLLVAGVAGVAAVHGRRDGRRWGLLGVGLTVFAVADVSYALQRTVGMYVVGTPLDAGWAIGLAVMAMSVNGVGRHDAPVPPREPVAAGGGASGCCWSPSRPLSPRSGCSSLAPGRR